METANFGTFLREERERRHISLAELARSTKLSVSSLKLMETGNLDDLPPDVFVRGFIRSYAKSLGIPSAEPLSMLDQKLSERHRPVAPVVVLAAHQESQERRVKEPTMPIEPPMEDDAQSSRHGIGLAVFVIIVLLIATITLSLFLRQQPPSGEGLSLEDGPSAVLPPVSGLG